MKFATIKLFAISNDYLDLASLANDCIELSLAKDDDLNDKIMNKLVLDEAKLKLISFLKDDRNARIVEHYYIYLCDRQLFFIKGDIGADLTEHIKEIEKIIGYRIAQYYLKKTLCYDDHQLLLSRRTDGTSSH